ncbi:chemotaxis protein CheW [Hyalangium versicolor]|uniref:chemotaxis protein CheW n=1 Tax=Hyalangium versicolor TaxID=2861190 RepID=UPI001CCF5B87|nr:chemotaxis protein CheW [Hyalangium versicolor]
MAEGKAPQPLDWEAAHARLAELEQATERGEILSPEEARAILEARARELARAAVPEKPVGTRVEVARFQSAGQSYALETRFVHEVLRDMELTPLPGAPPLLRGLTLLRGEVLPVVELAPLFGRPPSGRGTVVLVVGAHRPDLGVCVEAVEEITLLPRDALLPPPSTLPAEAAALVSGIHREGTLLLEGAALLRDSRLIFDLSEEGNP